MTYAPKRDPMFGDSLLDDRRRECQVDALNMAELREWISGHCTALKAPFSSVPLVVFEDTVFPMCITKFLLYASDTQKEALCQVYGHPDDSVLHSWATRVALPREDVAKAVLNSITFLKD